MSLKLVTVKKGQYKGEYYRWGNPTGEIRDVPAGKYYQKGKTLLFANKLEGKRYAPSTKHAYRLP